MRHQSSLKTLVASLMSFKMPTSEMETDQVQHSVYLI